MIIKLLKRKDVAKIRSSRNKLMGMDLSSLGIRGKVYINDSLCKYCKFLWKKCKSLQSNQFMQGFWVTNGTVRLKDENDRVHVITHLSELKELLNYSTKKISSYVFAYISCFILYLKASSFSKQSSYYFISFTFLQVAQSFLTELKGLYGVQLNVCDGGGFFTKIFYALIIFAERLSHGCSTGL